MGKTKQIRDIVYGFIKIDDQELAIVDHPVFQRLRRIKQLAFTDMVYPGACHTRFEHSLGVLHMATLMFNHIFDNYGEVVKKYFGIDDAVIFMQEKSRWLKIVRLAALLHDIGHAPFSHAGEGIMHQYVKNGKIEYYEHEDYSVAIINEKFKHIIEDKQYYAHVTVDEVVALIDKDEATRKGGEYLFLKQIISSQLDADRADYLLRDSAHMGVNYGVYDMARLISCLAVAEAEIEDGAKELRFAISSKGLYVAESLVIARYQMFKQIYFHKVRRIYDYHIREAMREILPDIGYDEALFPPPSEIDRYIAIDDWKIQGAIMSALEDGAHKHCTIVKNRRHYKKMFATKDVPTKRDLTEIKKWQEKYQEGEFHVDIPKTSWYKPEEKVWIWNDDTQDLVELSEESSLIKALTKENLQKVTFYALKEDGK